MDEQVQINMMADDTHAHSCRLRLPIMPSATGLHILHDSGVPLPDGDDHTTLIFVHGYGYHSGTSPLLLLLEDAMYWGLTSEPFRYFR